jgi:hypothetical protein
MVVAIGSPGAVTRIATTMAVTAMLADVRSRNSFRNQRRLVMLAIAVTPFTHLVITTIAAVILKSCRPLFMH